jgi:hypothetical protein
LEESWSEATNRLCGVSSSSAFWRLYSPYSLSLSKQGWKVHVPATPRNAIAILHIAVRTTLKHRLVLKFPHKLQDLVRLNAGLGSEYPQSGKIFTFYSDSESTLLEAAKELVTTTNRFRCPPVPFDERMNGGRNVYFRYGVVAGDAQEQLLAPDGTTYKDRREKGAAIPSWLISSKFALAALAQDQSRHQATAFLPADLLPFEALSQRSKGGVYKALDLSVSPGRVVVVKEGRLDGEINISGLDGYMLAKREARNLSLLKKFGSLVPSVFRTLDLGSHFFVVTMFLDGLSLSEFAIKHESASDRLALCNLLLLNLERLNQHGWLWRDCKPPNVVVVSSVPHFLDMEGACKKNIAHRSRWGSPGYLPNFETVPFLYQDKFAGLITVIQIMTGDFTPPERKNLLLRVHEAKLQKSLQGQLVAFLKSPSIATIDSAIYSITLHAVGSYHSE